MATIRSPRLQITQKTRIVPWFLFHQQLWGEFEIPWPLFREQLWSESALPGFLFHDWLWSESGAPYLLFDDRSWSESGVPYVGVISGIHRCHLLHLSLVLAKKETFFFQSILEGNRRHLHFCQLTKPLN